LIKRRGFFADSYSEKDEIHHSADAPFRMTNRRMRFFPFASLRVRMTKKGGAGCPFFLSP
jgi:hypothetical protein